jgi:predicted kinase
MTAPRLYLLCGLPGAGKTTRARRIVQAMNAVHLSPDEWLAVLGVSLVDFDFRFKMQRAMLAHAGEVLRGGASVIVEFGSWDRAERESIRRVAVERGATTELHFLDAPVDELVDRVRRRGGADAATLVDPVLLQYSSKFERPTPDEIALFDRFVGPDEDWP